MIIPHQQTTVHISLTEGSPCTSSSRLAHITRTATISLLTDLAHAVAYTIAYSFKVEFHTVLQRHFWIFATTQNLGAYLTNIYLRDYFEIYT